MTTGASSLLSWVKTEIDFSLKVVRDALAQMQDDATEANDLRVCPRQLHAVSGALRMVGLEGARQFCSALEGAFEGLVKTPTPKAANVAERAVVALQEFTENISNGGTDVPLKLFPIYRELAALQGRSDSSEKELFFPDLSAEPPGHPAKHLIADDAIPEHAAAQRSRFQRGLLAWIQKPADPAGLREMAQAVDALDRVSAQLPQPRALWWIAGALIDGLMQPPSPKWLAAARALCSKIDFQMRDLAKQRTQVNEPLLRDLLYVVASCPPATERLRAVKERYALDALLPEPDVGLDFDMDWLHPALADMRSRLDTAKNTWVEYLSGEPQRLARFRDLARALKARSDELGNTQLVRLFDVVVVVATRLPDPYPAGSEMAMLEMATAFLLAESMLDAFTSPPPDLEQQVELDNCWLLDAAAGKSAGRPPEGLRRGLVQQFNQTQLRAQVAKEILANLRHIEEVLDGYARDAAAKRGELPALAPELRQIHGALTVLGFADASALLDACDAMIVECATGDDAHAAEDMDWIAEGLSSLGLFLEPCVRGRAPESRAVTSFLERYAQRPPRTASIKEAIEPAPAADSAIAEAAALPSAPAPAVPATPQAPAAETAASSPDATVASMRGEPPAAHEPAAPVNEEMLDIFLEEADEVIASIGTAIPECHVRPEDREALTTVRRGFHTLKGSGRMVGLHELGEIAWVVEQVLNRWLEQRKAVTPQLLQLVDRSRVTFAGWVNALKTREPLRIDATDILALASRLKSGDEWVPTSEASVRDDEDREPAATEAVHTAPETAAETASAPATSDAPSELELAILTVPVDDAHVPSPLVAPSSAKLDAIEPAVGSTPEPTASAEAEVLVGNVRLSAALYEIYVKEAQQHVAALCANGRAWCEQPGTEAPPAWGLAAHTLAGISRTAGFTAAAELAGAFERWLPHARDTAKAEDARAIRAAIEALAQMVDAIAHREEPAACTELADRLRELASAPAYAAAGEKRNVQDDIDPQLLPLFLEEAQELLPLIGGDLRDWKTKPGDANIARSLKRSLHTLKGSARMAGVMHLGELAHVMESRLEAAESTGGVSAALVSELEAEMDRLSVGIDQLAGRQAPAALPAAVHQPALVPLSPAVPAAAAVTAPPAQIAADRPAAATAAAMLRISADTLDRLINEAGEASIARSRIEGEVRSLKQSVGELSDSVLRLRGQLREMELQADTQLQSRLSELEEVRADFDPLEFDRYTRLQELARMMGETMHDIMSIQQTLTRTADEADAGLLAQGRITRDLQQELMALRTVPFSSMTERLHRVVRQAAREAGKSAALEIRGEHVQLDRSVLERIAAPLEHLLRNAVAHGVEAPGQRATRGKSDTGAITLTLRQENDAVVLVLQDDGAGLDLEKLKERGVEKGLLAPDSQPSAAEVAQLIFASGLSTAEAVTELAGRGVGMDVVHREITAVGGRIEIDSTTGLGTTFTVYLPLTLAVAQAVLVLNGEQPYAIPSASVAQVLRVKAPELAALYKRGAVEAHGQQYPLHYLGHLLGTSEHAPASEGYSTVLLLRSGNQRTALHVDELVRNQEIVIKNVGPQLAGTPWIAGATVLGDGHIVLIINAVQLAQRARAASQASPILVPVAPAPVARTVMVVDDSLTVRKITSRLLEREGYRVLAAKDGVDALEQVSRSLPDIMLVDIEMPRMDGFDLTRNLRGDPRTASVPIIVISSRTADKHRTHAFELGVNDFIGKPYQEADLLAHIQKYLQPRPEQVH
jgi:chemosensory pili system protein ChpA (sensor histidine kinase/response regulator)